MAVDDSYTTLLHFDGADATTTFIDESGKTWSAAGNAQIDTDYYKFGGASGFFTANTDYISTPNHADFDLGTGDWTIDFQVRRNGAPTPEIAGIFSTAIATNVGYQVNLNTAGKISLYSKASGGWDIDLIETNAILDTTMTHIALVRYGNTLTIYKNGVADGTKNVTGYNYNSAAGGAVIGRRYTNTVDYTSSVQKWIDEFRFLKGIARWTADFIPPTSAYAQSSALVPIWFM